jgi:hypothetical protein
MEVKTMAQLDYETIKKMVEKEDPHMDVDAEVKKLRTKLRNLSNEGAAMIVANKLGIKVKSETPKPTIKTIESLRAGDDYIDIVGAVIEVYDLKFYRVCSACGKKVEEIAGALKCKEHGIVTPAFGYLLNVMLDDGWRIRVTMFSKQVEKLLGMDTKQVLSFRESPEKFNEIRNEMLGKLLAFSGTVTKNAMTDKLEFRAQRVYKEPKDVTPRMESVSALKEHQAKIPATPEEDLDMDGVEIEDVRGL